MCYLLVRFAVLRLFGRRTLCRGCVFEESILAGAGSGNIVGDSGESDSGFVGEFGEAGRIVEVDAAARATRKKLSLRRFAEGGGEGALKPLSYDELPDEGARSYFARVVGVSV